MFKVYLYIDPGTGSMLFAAMIGVISTLYFFMQKLWINLRFRMHGGNAKADVRDENKPVVIFGEDGRYWNSFRAVCEELEKRGIECDYYTMDEKDPVLEQTFEHIHPSFIGSDNRAYAKLNLMKADVCLATTPGLEVYQWKRSKNVRKYVHILHSADEGTGYRMFGMDDYDTVLLTGAFQERYIRMLEEMRNEEPKNLEVVGCTYMDELLKRVSKDGGNKIKKEDKAGYIVLLAPSWGESSILNRFGTGIIDALIKTGYHIIVRPHPQSRKTERHILDPLQKKYAGIEQVEWDESNDNFESLMRSDVLISDYSGVVFDFALVFDKPVMLADTSFDTAPYDAAWIDEPLWRLQILDDLGIKLEEKDFPDLKRKIDDLIGSDHYQEGRDKIRDIVWQNRGRSGAAIADYLERCLKEEA